MSTRRTRPSLARSAFAGFSFPPEGTGFGSTSATAFRHPGDGGSIGFADPDAHVGFGYVVNQLQAGMPPTRGRSA
jgi:CubicO group peptidase (beta-lactamase class C family)